MSHIICYECNTLSILHVTSFFLPAMPRFVVGELFLGLATLVACDDDHTVFQFPSHLLPEGTMPGAVVELQVSLREELQQERLQQLKSVLDTIENEVSSEVYAVQQRRGSASSVGSGSGNASNSSGGAGQAANARLADDSVVVNVAQAALLAQVGGHPVLP